MNAEPAIVEVAKEQKISMHPFEIAGLGKAPFRCVGMEEKFITHPTGTTQAAGTCDYCGTGIRYCYQIQSFDGKGFKVGCDCVGKISRSDNRLLSEVEAIKARHQREKKQAEHAAKWEKIRAENAERQRQEEANQRERNGGKTDEEMKKECQEKYKAKLAETNKWIIDVLEQAGDGDFIRSMIDMLKNETEIGDLRGRRLEIISDIYCKHVGGRRGSKKYQEASQDFDNRCGFVDV